MRIAVVGSANQGKTTLVSDIIKEWPMYRRSNESYREALAQLKVNKASTKESQAVILDCLINDINQTKATDNVLFDRCPLDNLVYTIWAYEKGGSDIDEDFIKESIEKVKESLRAFDIIFFTPVTQVAPIPLVKRDNRDLDPDFIKEIDNIFKVIGVSHSKNTCPFFVKGDAPPIIEIFGSQLERIEMVKLYLNTQGSVIDTASSILSNENIEMMENLMRDQFDTHAEEQKVKAQSNKIINAKLQGSLNPLDVFNPSKIKNKNHK